MTQLTLAIACAAAILAFTSSPAGAADCVEAHVTLTAESGEQSVLSCTESKPRVQDIADRRQQPAPAPVSGQPLPTTQSAQAR